MWGEEEGRGGWSGCFWKNDLSGCLRPCFKKLPVRATIGISVGPRMSQIGGPGVQKERLGN